MKRASFLIMLACLLGAIGSAWAERLTDDQVAVVLSEAQRDYDRGIALLRGDPDQARGLFASAARRFQHAADSLPPNGILRYNLANAQLQSGDTGRAIANYRRAERLIPGDARLRANLEHARTLVRSRIAPSGRRSLADALLGWHDRTSPQLRWRTLLVCYMAFWIATAIRTQRAGGALIAAMIVSGVLSLALGASLAADAWGWGRHPVGVIIQDDITVRKGNGLGFDPRFEQSLHAGTEFEVIEIRGEWLHIQLVDENTGWIETNVAEVI